MEKRLHDRQEVTFQVRLTAVASPELSASGETVDISKSGIAVCLPLQFAPGTIVQLEIADSVLYGFVINSQEWSPSSKRTFDHNQSSFFRTGLEVIEVLIGASGLSQLLKANLEEKMPGLQMTYSDPGR